MAEVWTADVAASGAEDIPSRPPAGLPQAAGPGLPVGDQWRWKLRRLRGWLPKKDGRASEPSCRQTFERFMT
eukprot:354903-Chlamydomonas_euryale.AAC.10